MAPPVSTCVAARRPAFLKINVPQFSVQAIDDFPFCDVCARTKMTQKTYDKIRTPPTRPGEIISADLIGPISPSTCPNGYRYALTLIDGFTKFARVFLLRRKGETGKYIKVFFDQVRAQHPTNGQIKIFRTDNGTEFLNKGVQKLIMKYGAEHQSSEPYTSQHNAVIERFNRTIEQKTRSLLSDSGFPTSFWGLAIGAAEYIYNRTPHSSLDYEQPIAKWENKVPQINHLAIFGALAYQLTPNKAPGKKFQEVSQLRFIAGYSDTGYILFDPQTKKTNVACNVKIDETRMYKDFYQHDTPPFLWDTSTDPSHPPSTPEIISSETPISGPQVVTVEVHQPPLRHSEPTMHDSLIQTQVSPTPEATSYRSLTLSDCSLPLHSYSETGQEDDPSYNTTESEQTFLLKAEHNIAPEYMPVEIYEVPDDGVDWDQILQENRRKVWENRPIVSDPDTIPQQPGVTLSPNLLFPIRVPDTVNKQDLFENPHPQAPKTFTEAMKRGDKSVWREVILDVWDVVPRKEAPPGVRPLPWKWVYTYKENGAAKARLVVIGSLDPEKYDPEETFSPVAPPYTIRWFFAFAHRNNYEIRQIDVKTAFLHSPINRDKYTFVPKGLQVCEKSNLLKLKKAAYGLAISPLLWFTTFVNELKKLGFCQSVREPCLLYKHSELTITMVLVYVDDVLIAGNSLSQINATIQNLKTRFLVKEMGFPETYVGFEVEKSTEQGTLILHQRTYARTFLKMFLPESQRGPRNTPMNTFGNFPKSETSEEPLSPSIPYRSIIGTLYYYANGTRPDILFAVNYLSRVQARPRNIHWTLLQQVLRYIDTTKELGLTFRSTSADICAFVDADFASDYSSRPSDQTSRDQLQLRQEEQISDCTLKAEIYDRHKSTTGCVIQAYGNTIAWLCRKQPAITTSTTEAEFVAMAESLSLILFLRQLTAEVSKLENTPPIRVYEDNISTATLLKSIFHHGRLKHLALRVLRVKELIWKKIIRVLPISTIDQTADILTKPLQADAFLRLRPRILGSADHSTSTESN